MVVFFLLFVLYIVCGIQFKLTGGLLWQTDRVQY